MHSGWPRSRRKRAVDKFLAGHWFRWSALLLMLVAVALVVLTPHDSDDFPADPGLLHKVGIVLPTGAGGAWDADQVESPSVVRDPDSGEWAMAYVGYGTSNGAQRGQIGLAYSGDGIHWKAQPKPIFGGSGVPGASDQIGVTGPVLVRDGDRWVMFYIGLTEPGYEGGVKTINYATSQHLAGPWVRQGAVIASGGNGWRAKAVWHPTVIRNGGQWFMFFNGTGTDGHERIGYATAAHLAGPWSVDDALSPVLDIRPGGWDSDKVADPFVRHVGDHWVMDYYGYDRGDDHAADGEAVTSDADFPTGWHRTHLEVAPSKSYDSRYAHKPWVITIGGRLFHYYTAVGDDGVRRIALAVSGKQPS